MAKIGFFNAVLSDAGVPIQATITVYEAGGLVLATIFSDADGLYENVNPFQTDTLGRFSFFADIGRYDIQVSGVGITTFKIESYPLSMVTRSTELIDMPRGFTSGSAARLLRVTAAFDGYELIAVADMLADPLAAAFAVEDWIAPTLLNSWSNHGSPNEAAGYYKDPFGIVHLRGRIDPGTWANPIFQLPAGYRPNATQVFPQVTYYSADWHTCPVQVGSDGNIGVFGTTGDRVYLDGITFKAV